MDLKIILPFRVLIEEKNVKRIVAETNEGFLGLLPQRLDCVAALVPGIFTYETESTGVHYVAVDEGVLVKAGSEVRVSVRNAVGGVDLGMLHETIEKEFLARDESDKITSMIMTKLESSFIESLEKFRQ